MVDTERMTSIAGRVAFELFVPGYMKAAYSALTSSQNDLNKAESEGLVALEEEARKQKIVMEFQAHQARVAQELAIAERIAASHDVVIEEFFDGSGKGHVGLSTEGESISIGAGGEGRRVTKRVIRFSSWGETMNPSKKVQPLDSKEPE